MYKTILCATDGSDSATEAVEVAAQLAKAFGSKLIYLHVAQPSHLTEAARRLAEIEHVTQPHSEPAPEIAGIPMWIATAEEINTRADDDFRVSEYLGRSYLRDAEETATDAGVSDVQSRVEAGHPVEEILRVANETHADAIVLGARGLSDIKGVLLGSVSHKVTHDAHCTCITVR